HLGDLAYHFHEAGVPERALAYGERVGQRALELYAPRAAVEHLGRAIAAAGQLGPVPPRLHRLRGLAHETLGDFEAARADHEAALAAARAAGDAAAEWQSLLDLGLLWAGRDYATSGAYCDAALALARTLGDPPRV